VTARLVLRFLGGYVGGATPVPIPNTVVKPSGADDSGISRESRTLPGFFASIDLSRFIEAFYFLLVTL
jgi:hypothetical protein